jgi:hypothetical protein
MSPDCTPPAGHYAAQPGAASDLAFGQELRWRCSSMKCYILRAYLCIVGQAAEPQTVGRMRSIRAIKIIRIK